MSLTPSHGNHLQPPISADQPPLGSDAQCHANPQSNESSEQAPVAVPITPIDDRPISNAFLELPVIQVMDSLQQAGQGDVLPSEACQFLHRYTYTYAPSLVSLVVLHHLSNATSAVAGSAMLKTIDDSYQLGEAALTATLGTLFILPPCLFLERSLALEEAPSMKFKYSVYFSRCAYYFLVPMTGYVVAQHVARQRMNLSQHLAAFGLGSVTLFIPMLCIHAMVLFKLMSWGYFPREESNRSTRNRTRSPDSIENALPVAIASESLCTPPNQNNTSTEASVYDQSGQVVRYLSRDVSSYLQIG